MPSSAIIAQRSRLLAERAQLGHLPAAELQMLASAATLRGLPARGLLDFEQAGLKPCLLVVDGAAEALTQDAEGRARPIEALGPGSVYGSEPIFGGRCLANSVRANDDTLFMQWSADWLRDHQHQLREFIAWLETSYQQRRMLAILARVPLLCSLPLELRQSLSNYFVEHTFERDTIIVMQGTAADAFYLIDRGQCSVEQHQQLIATLTDGDFFGEMALLSNKPHGATVRALTSTVCLALPGDVFATLVEANPRLASSLQSVIEERRRNAERMRDDPQQRKIMQTIVEQGIFRGTHVLARRPALCPTGCRLCEEACTERFGQTRIHLGGIEIDAWDITMSCRQCRIGAECMEACPEAAIIQDVNGVLRVTEGCTGCGDCLPACPYGVIERQDIAFEAKGGPLWMLWGRLKQLRGAQPERFVASKCDLCVGYSDRACLSRCPTGALQLVPVEEIFPL